MKVGPLYAKLRDCVKKFIVCQGGGDAGKTVTILQVLAVEKAIKEPYQIIQVVGQDIPNLKKGSLRAFQRYVYSDESVRTRVVSYNKTERIYTFDNGSTIEFASFGDEQDARGSECDYLFINECNGISYNIFWQLQRKCRKQVFLDYNPSSRFWVHEKLLSGNERIYNDRVIRFIIDHRHNPFLSKEDHEAYENISDPDMFKVYARGLTGKIKGLIFGHFKKVSTPPAIYDRIIWGIDYGYTNDPTALVKIYCIGRERVIVEMCYEPGLSAEAIKALLIQNGYESGQPIYSEADPNMVNQLRALRIPVSPAIKGPGSEIAGIAKVKQYDCSYIGENFEKEINAYKWMMAEDIQTGKEVMTNVPLKGNDHLCDATRYAIYTDSFRKR